LRGIGDEGSLKRLHSASKNFVFVYVNYDTHHKQPKNDHFFFDTPRKAQSREITSTNTSIIGEASVGGTCLTRSSSRMYRKSFTFAIAHLQGLSQLSNMINLGD
jgi:hypothetical protein